MSATMPGWPLHDIALLSGMQHVHRQPACAGAGRLGGHSAQTFAPMLKRYIDAMLGFVDGAAEQIDKRDYTIEVVSNIGMQSAAYVNLIETARDQGIGPNSSRRWNPDGAPCRCRPRTRRSGRRRRTTQGGQVITFIGTGPMGQAMVRALVSRARSDGVEPDTVEAEGLGATVAPTVADALPPAMSCS